jgi:hypothetical protein
MPAPALDSFASDLYKAVLPIAEPYDAQRGYALAYFVGALGGMFQPVEDLVRDPSILVDPDRAPADWLGWLSQFNDAGIPPQGSGDVAADRLALKSPPRARRGTVPAIIQSVQALLTGSKSVFYNERVGGNAFHGSIATLVAETPSPAAVAALFTPNDRRCIKPALTIIDYTTVTGTDWQTLRDTHTDWADVRGQFTDWQGVKDNPSLT